VIVHECLGNIIQLIGFYFEKSFFAGIKSENDVASTRGVQLSTGELGMSRHFRSSSWARADHQLNACGASNQSKAFTATLLIHKFRRLLLSHTIVAWKRDWVLDY
jgi:hypothetical protein